MEKRRRARINNCLNELKALILDATKKDVSFTHHAAVGDMTIPHRLLLIGSPTHFAPNRIRLIADDQKSDQSTRSQQQQQIWAQSQIWGAHRVTLTESHFGHSIFLPQPRHSKFEKADILEKTVKHLQDLQRQQSILTQATDPNVLNKFKAGFSECASEVGRFGGIDPAVKRRLLQHLSNCLTGVKTSTTSTESNLPVHILPSPPSSPEQSADKLMGGRHPVVMTATTPATAPAPGHKQQSSFNHITLSSNGYFLSNGNGGVGVQLIPTKLTNGSIAFVVPPSGLQYPAQASAGAVQPQPNNNTPLPMLIPIPSRQPPVPSHSSGSSNPLPSNNNNNSCSSSSSHGSLVRSTSTSPQHHFHMQHNQSYDRRTPSSSYGSMDSQTMSPPSSPCQGPPYKRARSSTENHNCDDDVEERESECHSPEPLSLVLRKRRSSSSLGNEEADEADKQCWRPW